MTIAMRARSCGVVQQASYASRQVRDTGGAVDQGLDAAELDEHVGRARVRTPAPPAPAAAARPPRPTAPRAIAVRAAARSTSTVAGLPRRGARSRWAATCSAVAPCLGRSLSGPLVVQRPLAGRQVVVDGVADQRMDEGEVVARP